MATKILLLLACTALVWGLVWGGKRRARGDKTAMARCEKCGVYYPQDGRCNCR